MINDYIVILLFYNKNYKKGGRKMAVFSQRNGYSTSTIQIESASDTLKRRIFATFYKEEYDINNLFDRDTTGIEEMMIEMGITYEYPYNKIYKDGNAKKLEKEVINSKEWFTIYDFIEKYLSICDEKKAYKMQDKFNEILEDEVSAYRILDKEVIPITNKVELSTIEEAKNSSFNSVNIHLDKALGLFADRKRPDYENSIKESISAVEAMCCIITGLDGKNATLGTTLKKLKEKGVHIHSALEKSFSSLYGYTSDEDGIRHGGIDFTSAPSEDARYMLISCSAFINYLAEKWRKVK